MKISVKVITNAKKNKIEKLSETVFKVWLTVQPIEGKANKMLIQLLAKKLKLPKSKILIIRGKASKLKTINLDI